MKGLVVKSPGPLRKHHLSEVDIPKIKPDEVLIKVKFAGVNYPDILISKGLYQYRPELPFCPGGEVSGDVVECGADVTSFQVGDAVLAGIGWGGFAEYAVASATNVYNIPAGITYQVAANILETYATAFHALKDRANLKKGERILVLGASGGTGTAAVQLGKLLGAEVIACASTIEKLEFAKYNGASLLINYQSDDLREKLRSIGGVDVVFDPVGGAISDKALRSLRMGGRHLIIGFASGQIPKIPWNIPLLKQASIVGVSWGGLWRTNPGLNRCNVEQLLKWVQENKILPKVGKVFPLSQAISALEMLEKRSVKGKVCLKVLE